eukprot:TRINITY_DN32660_c0_g1_i1.p1 TRINITY_DN32660_c0_g1~~TRINITY_DN32660_c0_g1_i1.p1  ORF type:complete len:199 (-),score=19.28 TRINITY_DN32660_c0_g1_i1:174-770(-)
MGGQLSLEECTSPDNPRVRDCCHLEGETPIEIRIAYGQHQQPRPSAYPSSYEPGRRPPTQLGAGAAASRYTHAHALSADAHMPPMPLGADNLRLPPPPVGEGKTDAKSELGDFAAETFAAPLDSERSAVSTNPGRIDNPLALQMYHTWYEEDSCFPEVVRASKVNRSKAIAQPQGSETQAAQVAAMSSDAAVPGGEGF